MLYKVVGGATIGISSICVLTQLVLLPWLHQYTIQLRAEFESRLRKFHHNARQFDDQIHRLSRLTGVDGLSLQEAANRAKRQLEECPPVHPGAPGLPGEVGADGEPGDPGEHGSQGLDAAQLLLQEAQKCVECPAGPSGPIGAPGHHGYLGPKGDKGEQGVAGNDGVDGEQGPEGLAGLPGIGGKPGKKGAPGISAPGGTGPPGPPGVRGPLGPTGKQGERGRRNFVIGMPGQDGRSGKQGLDGLEGKPGQRGEKGLSGEDGADARFCPCPSELNKMGGAQTGDKLRSHLAPPAPIAVPQMTTGEEQRQPEAAFIPVPAEPPAPIQSPGARQQHGKSVTAIPVIQSSQSVTEKHSPLVMDHGIKQQTKENGTTAAGKAKSLRISHLKAGEQPTNENEAEKQIKEYEDVYPNYDQQNGEKTAGNGDGRSKSTVAQYDDEQVQQMNTPREGAERNRNGETGTVEEPMEDGVEKNGEERAEEDQQDEQQPAATRRFLYVTKRPRPKL